MPRAILHVDMDAFYASVEQRDAPALRGVPVIVGGHPRRGVVLAASYEVRPFGVGSAMPMAWAVQRAPHAVVVPPRPRAYAEASERVFEIFSRYTPLIEPLSLDEAFLDVTASRALFGEPSAIAARVRREIAHELELPASAGIAPSKFVAKIVSDLAKPNGQREVTEPEVKAFLAPLPVERLWGVGPKGRERLQGLGLRTIGDLARSDTRWLVERLGEQGRHLQALSRGHDERPVIPDARAKSIGSEDTFEEDLGDREALRPHLHSQALRVGRRLRRAGVKTRVVQLKVKYADFEQVTRRRTLEAPTDDGQTLYRVADALLERLPLDKGVRLTGVSAQELGGAAAQGSLFAASETGRSDRLNAALDLIAERFGSRAVRTADLSGLAEEADEGEGDDEARRSMGSGRIDRASK